LLVIALARPQSKTAWQDKTTEGIDIIISFDVSASMLAKDFEPNRLDAAKSIAIDFISQRPNDRIGLVIYEGEAFTQCPLTTDHKVLTNLFREVRSGLIDGGTAIGMGLATAVNRLKESEAKSRVVILLTDGVNNAGAIPPVTAAEIAREFGVRVYAIGVGTKGRALSPIAIYPNGQYKYDYVEVQIDEDALTQVAQMTNGKYFRATDNNSLKSIYQEIDTLEKTRIQVTQHSKRHEEFFIFALFGLSLIAFEFFLKNTVFRTVT
jgi:Ca-activated chloride channel homolog